MIPYVNGQLTQPKGNGPQILSSVTRIIHKTVLKNQRPHPASVLADINVSLTSLVFTPRFTSQRYLMELFWL